MKVLGICGSPRKNGNSDILLDEALKGAREAGAEVDKMTIEELDISPCGAEEYDKVDERGLSPVRDDMQRVYDAIFECDAIILASPIFFGSVSSQTKMMIDRFQCVWVSRNVLGKEVFPRRIKGGFICVEATERDDFIQNARSITRHFFATVNAEYIAEAVCKGLDAKGAVKEHPEYLAEAKLVGRKLATS
ncbi:MAG: flavodoxin family protein [Candidatus Omnitrophica bacterium]|nr:flavodoxin family protein [Candidatus Omnitrophota bacterium]